MRKSIKFTITIALLCVLGVALYYHFSNTSKNKQDKNEEDSVTVSEVDRLISKKLDENYPLTAREVVNLYTRIQKCYYNVECSSEELVKLAYMSVSLFDDELVQNNPFDEYYSELVSDIEQYKKDGKTISRVIVDKSSDIVYSTVEGQKYASVNCIYYLKTKDQTEKTMETYVLRKDNEDRWKILGWKLYEEKGEE